MVKQDQPPQVLRHKRAGYKRPPHAHEAEALGRATGRLRSAFSAQRRLALSKRTSSPEAKG